MKSAASQKTLFKRSFRTTIHGTSHTPFVPFLILHSKSTNAYFSSTSIKQEINTQSMTNGSLNTSTVVH